MAEIVEGEKERRREACGGVGRKCVDGRRCGGMIREKEGGDEALFVVSFLCSESCCGGEGTREIVGWFSLCSFLWCWSLDG